MNVHLVTLLSPRSILTLLFVFSKTAEQLWLKFAQGWKYVQTLSWWLSARMSCQDNKKCAIGDITLDLYWPTCSSLVPVCLLPSLIPVSMEGYIGCCFSVCSATDISATVSPIGVTFSMMVHIGLGQIFSTFGGGTPGSSNSIQNFGRLTVSI